MSEYKNFNGYPEEATNVSQPAEVTVYAGTEQTKSSGTGYGVAATILAPLSCCCCGVPAVIGLILGIVGLTKNKKSVICIIGTVLCSLTLLYFAYSIIYTMNHPEEYQQIMDMYQQMLEQYAEMAEYVSQSDSARISGILSSVMGFFSVK